jgi:hypothetical protein
MAEVTLVRVGGKGGPLKMAEKHLRLAAEKAKARMQAGV